MTETLSSAIVSTKQQQIAQLAGKMPGKALYSLAHHMDVAWMMEAYRRTRKDGAVGIDGQTAAHYTEHLEENLQDLLNRAKSGERYCAPPVKRVYIPKGDGSERPLGIPTFEDKVLQRAVVMVLEGKNAISRYRELMGATNYKEAAKGTIRHDFATDIEKNVVHGSDAAETAAFEIGYFFNAFEIHAP